MWPQVANLETERIFFVSVSVYHAAVVGVFDGVTDLHQDGQRSLVERAGFVELALRHERGRHALEGGLGAPAPGAIEGLADGVADGAGPVAPPPPPLRRAGAALGAGTARSTAVAKSWSAHVCAASSPAPPAARR